MDEKSLASIDQAKEAALRILLHNARGPFQGLPRTAGWGYPEPYTRDLMISALGFLATGNEELADALRRTLVALATNQTPRGLIPSLAHDPADRGASDTTPLFLFGLALYRKSANQPDFLDEAAQNALKWMQYQSPDDMVMVSQLPTSDWRDEQWVMGFGLYVNTLVYAYLVLYGEHESAGQLRELMNRLEVRGEEKNPHEHEGLVVPSKPYYALYSYKLFNSDRFDLLGNSLAILTGIASPHRAETWWHGSRPSVRPCGTAESWPWICRLVCSRISCPTMPIGGRDTSDSTGPASITTGAYGLLSAASMWRHA